MHKTVFVTCGAYEPDDPRHGLQLATLAHARRIADTVYIQAGSKPAHQRLRYQKALTHPAVKGDSFVTIMDDDVLLEDTTRRWVRKETRENWHDYVARMFGAHPDVGYLGPWLIPCDGSPPATCLHGNAKCDDCGFRAGRHLHPMSVVGGIRFIRKGVLDPYDLRPMTPGRNGYDDQIARMLQGRGWRAAKLPRLKCRHLGRGFSTIRNDLDAV